MTQTDARAMTQAAADGIAAAEATVRAGGSVDLKALERGVVALCQALARLPAAEAKPLAEALPPLVDALDRLAEAVRAGAGGLVGPADSVAGKRRAAAAYAAADPRRRRGG